MRGGAVVSLAVIRGRRTAHLATIQRAEGEREAALKVAEGRAADAPIVALW